jgi:hypothetical protein
MLVFLFIGGASGVVWAEGSREPATNLVRPANLGGNRWQRMNSIQTHDGTPIHLADRVVTARRLEPSDARDRALKLTLRMRIFNHENDDPPELLFNDWC